MVAKAAAADPGKGYTYWLGGNDRRKEGDWVWGDGRKFVYTNWAPGEPDDMDYMEVNAFKTFY